MSETNPPEKSDKPKVEERPESPTTAKALDFDDEAAETPSSPSNAASTNAASSRRIPQGEATPPPKPPRPIAPEQQAEITLKEAFPSIDIAVVRAVLRASGGRVEPAFNALLGMSDPDAAEPPPLPQPPRPAAPATSTEASQLAADERYARQLAEQLSGAPSYNYGPRPGPGQERGPARRPPQQRQQQYEEERERSFIDDDLPIIRDNIRKGFLETQSTVNKWVTSLKKKIDGEDDNDFSNYPAPPAQGYPSGQYGSRGSSEFSRRSTDRERYDSDPQVLGDDFANLKMEDHEATPRPSRPLANPNLFKPSSGRPPPSNSASARRVSFQEGPPEEIDIHYPNAPTPANPTAAANSGKSSKWQPLSAVDPSPVSENDPFSLGDSEDEEAKNKDGKPENSEELKKAAAEAMSENIGSQDSKKSGSEKT